MPTADRRRQRTAEPLQAPAEPETVVAEPGYRIAAEPLHVAGGALAHVAGDRVLLDNVQRNGWHDKVLMPPPDPPHHVAIPAQPDSDTSDADGDDGPRRPDQT
jgi:hypothetical protein